MMDSFIHRVELQTTLLLRSAFNNIIYFWYIYMSIDLSSLCGVFRFLMTEATMEQQQTCGHVVLFSMSCLQVTCLSMILILWIFIRKWANSQILHFFRFEYFQAILTSFYVCLQISSGEFNCPPWLSLGAMKLITRILDPNPMTVSSTATTFVNNKSLSSLSLLKSCCVSQRVTPQEVFEDEWFKKDYKPPVFEEKDDSNMDDVDAVFKDSEVRLRIVLFFPFILY